MVNPEEAEVVVETAIDFEDKAKKQLDMFKFADRNSSSDLEKSGTNRQSYLKNVEFLLDKKLILLVNEPGKSAHWRLPKLEWTLNDKSLRNVIFLLNIL